MRTLLTEYEAVMYGRLEKSVPGCDLSDIAQIEQREFRNRLGWDFYQELLGDMHDYTDEGEWGVIQEWDVATNYPEGNYVLYDGAYWVADTDTIGEPPPHTDWSLAQKFAEACFNTLFCDYLGRYLALCLIKNSTVPMAIQMKAAGIVQQMGDDFKPVSDKMVDKLQNWYGANISLVFENMHDWMIRVNDPDSDDSQTCKGKFANYKGIKDINCSDPIYDEFGEIIYPGNPGNSRKRKTSRWG